MSRKTCYIGEISHGPFIFITDCMCVEGKEDSVFASEQILYLGCFFKSLR